jgi:hypothetical protein
MRAGETNVTGRKATESEQKYADKAAYYVDRAMRCYMCQLWPESLNNFGSALESLLRVRFGSGGVLNDLIKKFDADTFFNSVIIHDGVSQECTTCYADRVRILRNAVHPDCWKEATKEDVDNSRLLVVLLYHALVVCEGQRIAVFQDSPEPMLKMLESDGKIGNDTLDTKNAT